MPLTPADVHNVAFKKPPIGKRGYDDEEVDAFLDLVEAELARLIEENADLRNQVADLESRAGGSAASSASSSTGQYAALHKSNAVDDSENYSSSSATGQYATLAQNARDEEPGADTQNGAPQAPSPQEPAQQEAPAAAAAQPAPAAPASSPVGDHEKASRILALATETADRHLSEAKSEADKHLSDAKTHAESLRTKAEEEHSKRIGDAKAEAEKHVTEARTSAAALLAESQSKAAATEKDAQTKAEQLAQAAEQKKADILRALEERKSSLERRIESLHSFETAYRTRIQGYLSSQLKEIEDLPALEPAGGIAGDGAGAHSAQDQGGSTKVSGFVGSSDAQKPASSDKSEDEKN
ncbi:DivIVA domain-containing protein [Antricoccus suffuscus]|uniref:Cell wall synthesis protein Wag31 n=1 Tax=Antricoccus suffuscus TaxID=1629062 RepID=A0A2T0Z686_9ACTN|nr:DivIVA domain-containing protein [Antricoccus suffuscus]PRZ31674.1 DivIVA domain-containing protein [Antricoccus suffuscus]